MCGWSLASAVYCPVTELKLNEVRPGPVTQHQGSCHGGAIHAGAQGPEPLRVPTVGLTVRAHRLDFITF